MNESFALINPSRLRKIPSRFSWLDQRLVHEGYLQKLSPEATGLYLFLACVSDHRGLSYYSDSAIKKRLACRNIASNREELIEANLLAYAAPFYQLLSLAVKEDKASEPGIKAPAQFLDYLEKLK